MRAGSNRRVPRAEPAGFSLLTCAANATDVVVVDPDGLVLESWRGELTAGEVVRLGPASLTLANALPLDYLRLRPDRTLSIMYSPITFGVQVIGPHRVHDVEFTPQSLIGCPDVPEVAETQFRFVLFLRKEGTTGVGRVWMPAASPGKIYPTHTEIVLGFSMSTLDYRFSCSTDSSDVHFSTSVALVEAGRVLALQFHQHAVPKAWEDLAFQAFPTMGNIHCVARNLPSFKEKLLSLPAR